MKYVYSFIAYVWYRLNGWHNDNAVHNLSNSVTEG